jgi:hypothetical protein
MNNTSENMLRPKKDVVKAFDPTFDDSSDHSSFDWNENNMMIQSQPNTMSCPSCNYSLNLSSDPMDLSNCKNINCGKCGYSVKSYGYGENDLSYDGALIDSDYSDYNNDNNNYDDNNDNNNYDDNNDINYDNNYVDDSHNYDNIIDRNNRSESEKYEYMTPVGSKVGSKVGSDDSNIGLSGCCTFVCCMGIILFLTYLLAYKRGEIYQSDGVHVNWSLVVCIFFFYQIYIGYALVDWLTKPNHGPYVTTM